jgi:hypothetical protein
LNLKCKIYEANKKNRKRKEEKEEKIRKRAPGTYLARQ